MGAVSLRWRFSTIRRGHVDEALTVLSDGIDRYPSGATPLVVRAGILSEQEEPVAALQDLEAAAGLAPDNPLILTNRAQLYRCLGRDGDALADLDRAVAIAPDFVAARYNRGSLRYERGDPEGALEHFDRCIAVDPHLAVAYFNRVSVHAALGAYHQSLTDIDCFLEISDDSGWNEQARRLRASWVQQAAGADVAEP